MTVRSTAVEGQSVRHRLVVTGTVQGVGFRPHVHRVATDLGVSGLVGNDSASVFIEVQGSSAQLEEFRRRLVEEAPPLAIIEDVRCVPMPPAPDEVGSRFAIVDSRTVSGRVTTAPPDTAPCVDCLREMTDPFDRRHRHPFITCTGCGPRFTIITSLPYDRPATTMADFSLCTACRSEYTDVADRRFHAQPIACHDCGPRLRLQVTHPTTSGPVEGDAAIMVGVDAVIASTQQLLHDGAIVAIKGVGGFHLACTATDESAVALLRQRKHRPAKPFAVMVPDLETARSLAQVDDAEAGLLTAAAAPIVLLRRRTDGPGVIAAGVAPDNPLIGLMLPSSPLHHLLFMAVPGQAGPVPDALVMTSGNLSEEPLCIDDDEALDRLSGIADAFVLHDRPIAVPCDDSVVRMGAAGQVVLRRSRGYVPASLPLPFDGEPTLAVGGQLKTTAALTDGHRIWLSPHIGDMGSLPTLSAFEHTIARFAAMHEVVPTRLAVDAHPDYATRRWALAHAAGRSIVQVQHHHAHIASLMVEHGLDGTTPIIGMAFDGTGYGHDGTIWGGEVLLADYDVADRVAHLGAVPLPGGDAAIRHPRRVALSHLRHAGVPWAHDLPPVAATDDAELSLIAVQLDRMLNCVPTSSMGRLFDAVASLMGVRHDIAFEAQAAIELEILGQAAQGAGVQPAVLDLPVVAVSTADGPLVIDPRPLIRGVVAALRSGLTPGTIALGFHHAVAEAVCDVARVVRDRHGATTVGLSGGVFTNVLLTRLVLDRLTPAGFDVLHHQLIPCNDGGLAVGQAAIAARRQRHAPR